jgi:hypothetical protein
VQGLSVEPQQEAEPEGGYATVAVGGGIMQVHGYREPEITPAEPYGGADAAGSGGHMAVLMLPAAVAIWRC